MIPLYAHALFAVPLEASFWLPDCRSSLLAAERGGDLYCREARKEWRTVLAFVASLTDSIHDRFGPTSRPTTSSGVQHSFRVRFKRITISTREYFNLRILTKAPKSYVLEKCLTLTAIHKPTQSSRNSPDTLVNFSAQNHMLLMVVYASFTSPYSPIYSTNTSITRRWSVTCGAFLDVYTLSQGPSRFYGYSLLRGAGSRTPLFPEHESLLPQDAILDLFRF